MEVSTRAALGHIHVFGHPNVIITDEAANEDYFFSKGVADKADDLNLPIIQLPTHYGESIKWVAKLDSQALKGMPRQFFSCFAD